MFQSSDIFTFIVGQLKLYALKSPVKSTKKAGMFQKGHQKVTAEDIARRADEMEYVFKLCMIDFTIALH